MAPAPASAPQPAPSLVDTSFQALPGRLVIVPPRRTRPPAGESAASRPAALSPRSNSPNSPKTAAIRPLPLPPPMPPAPPAPVAAPSLVDTLFQRSLDDLVKSLRADPSAAGESAAVARALSEIQREIRAADAATKAVALQKLTYLSSLHFAPVASHPLAFPAIELLASPHLPHKRIAYLAASLLLHPASLSLLPLATHQLHKDLSPSAFSAAAQRHVSALALQLLASPAAAAVPDLAIHLAQDLVPHLFRSCPRAIAAATRVIAASPSATVPVLFKPLAACLASPDPRASTAAAAAFCDLSAPPADAGLFPPTGARSLQPPHYVPL
ncbi:hypothetical protein PR202_ga31370 [Eleusine coracana subsp. coracana]|uniref:Uncharacterized protein n=1 Tax=Eleusine coracana subsp. coracana TaxID=191504 RepID=A0AAV5DRA9_ELECO|nr:hypothetical protein PR202_ga31370 [Eleusine coracana subsp. coracana]